MKKIIDRRLYDTETAVRIAEYNTPGQWDFRSYWEVLYKTKKGNWFIEYKGGPASKYAYTYPGGASGDHGIKEVTEDYALDWLEETENTDILLELFPQFIEEG